jgi:hypothetical protein
MGIAEYTLLVSQIEAGQSPHGFDRLAIDRLIAEICVAPWKNPEEREEGQRLVARLFRVGLRLVSEPAPAVEKVRLASCRPLPEQRQHSTAPAAKHAQSI